jgi:hypothetical protein
LIVGKMLERLYFADLVLADMTIPNGNVHCEVGFCHAVHETGCGLLAERIGRSNSSTSCRCAPVGYPLPATLAKRPPLRFVRRSRRVF